MRRVFSRPWFLLVLLPGVLLVLIALATHKPTAQWQGDLDIYARYANEIVHGKLPYRDVKVEYPPLALLPMLLPRIVTLGYALPIKYINGLFLLGNALWATILAGAMWRVARQVGRRPWVAMLVLAGLVGTLAPMLGWRFDLFPAMLTALALVSALAGRDGWAGGWLGLGIAAKLYPVVLGPVFAARALARLRWRKLLALALGAGLAVALAVGPFLLVGRAGLLSFLLYHENRGVQIESLAGGLVLLGVLAGQTTATVVFTYGSLNLESPWATALLPWAMPLFVVLYGGLVAALVVREVNEARMLRDDPSAWASRLIQASAAALLVFIVANKVYSPQYLAWLLPFVLLLRPGQIALFGAICIATIIFFPFFYQSLLDFVPWTIWLLNARNLATVALLVWVVLAPPRLQLRA
ncbi:DUF2029 domain-containing protein [Chloroflexia bacterium SDU3-3]|nr:DUF2029 domain-containing protein [Chloroflexia bacterium SDU3-3]